MSQSKTIGITGGIGTGKSTVTEYIRKKGYRVIDFDKISKTIYCKGKKAYYEILSEFGDHILDDREEVDRGRLAEIVFENSSKLHKLNSITHKHIFEEAKDIISEIDEGILFLDIPLLYEVRSKIKDAGINIDEIWLVYSDTEDQIERIMKRDNISRQEAISRISSQIPTEKKLQFADKIICNIGDKRDIYGQVDRLLKEI